MPIKFHCPHCNFALNVKDEGLAGKKGPCPRCKKVIVVPRPVIAMAPTAAVIAPFADKAADTRPQPPAPPNDVPTGPNLQLPSSAEAATTPPVLAAGGLLGTAAPSAPVTGPVPALDGHNRYRLMQQLGQGGMGSVYLAEHLIMGRHVALKFVNAELVVGSDSLARFRQEVRAAARLSHENIVAAYDADEVNGVHFLVMEFIEGVTLADAVALRGPLPIAEACDYVRQAALGLQHAHEKGMVHRDIKPANLMLTPAGRVKVLDFGLARFAREQGVLGNAGLTGSGVVMGTADYIAPEQTRSGRIVDIRADIYSLGCTLYHLLTGRVPFPEGSIIDKMIHHAMDAPPPIASARPDLPQGLIDVVEKMMAKDAAARFQTPAEVAERLARFTGGAAPVVEEVYILPDIEEEVSTRPLASITAKEPSVRKSSPSVRIRREREAAERDRSAAARPGRSVWITLLAVLSLAIGLVMFTAGFGLASCFLPGVKRMSWITLPFSALGLLLGGVALFRGLRARPRRFVLSSGGVLTNLVAISLVGLSMRSGGFFNPPPQPPVLEATATGNIFVRVLSVELDNLPPSRVPWPQNLVVRIELTNQDKQKAVSYKSLASTSSGFLMDDLFNFYVQVDAPENRVPGLPVPPVVGGQATLAAGDSVVETLRFGVAAQRPPGNLNLTLNGWQRADGTGLVQFHIPTDQIRKP